MIGFFSAVGWAEIDSAGTRFLIFLFIHQKYPIYVWILDWPMMNVRAATSVEYRDSIVEPSISSPGDTIGCSYRLQRSYLES